MKITSRRAVLTAVLAAAGAGLLHADAGTAAVGRVTLEDFKKDLDAGKVVVIDVRSVEAYRAGHIPGSLSVPLGSVEQHVARLKAAKKPVVAYCT